MAEEDCCHVGLIGECAQRSLWRGPPRSQITVGEPQACSADLHDLAPPQQRHKLGRVIVAGDAVGRRYFRQEVQHEGLGPIAQMEDAFDSRAAQTFYERIRQPLPEARQMGVRDDADPQ